MLLMLISNFVSIFSDLDHCERVNRRGRVFSLTVDPQGNMAERPTRMPSYFLGIGGPNFMENIEHPAYLKLAEIGREITQRVQPRAIVVFSAHWQAHGNKVQVNAAEDTDLIYDFYGFPPHYYEYEFPNKGSPEIADKIAEILSAAGVEVEKVKRGLDHGVWVGFMAGKSQADLSLDSHISER